MRRQLDLDLAALAVDRHADGWLARGLRVAPLGWRHDANGHLLPGRDPLSDPLGLVVQIAGDTWDAVLVVELSREGWAYPGYYGKAGAVRERRRVRSPGEWDAVLNQAVERASRIRLQQAQLMARTCTTGWLDWIHGELWLTPTCLLRVRSGLMDSVVNSFGSGLPARDQGRTVGYDPDRVLTGHRTNKLIPFPDIARARLRGGITTSSLTVDMRDGTRHKLLWKSSDPARRLLTDRLLPILGARLIR